jgi:tRNA (guanine-N7-)-methyltransferase
MSPGRKLLLAELSPRFALTPTGDPIDQLAVFGRLAPLVVEIGFGMGEATAERAAAEPELDVVALDIHTPGVAHLMRLLAAQHSTNVRVIEEDALDVLPTLVPGGTLAALRISFPDPWPKVRQQHRRLVNARTIGGFVDLLAPGGRLELATDWDDYADQMLAVIAGEPRLENLHGGRAPRPPARPVTKFERRALAEGRSVADIVAVRS